MEKCSPDEKSLQKTLYAKLSVRAAAITLNLIIAGYAAFWSQGETLDYPVVVPILHIYFWLLMLPALILLVLGRNFRFALACFMLAGYIIICLCTGLL